MEETNQKISLLLRHSDRDDIPKDSFGHEVLLNEKGIQKALQFGESLAHVKVNKIYSSPIERCVQTAELIVKGINKSVEIIEANALGAPGLHINDENIAGNFFLQHGIDELYKRFMRGLEIPGMPNAKELNRRMSTFLKEKTVENGRTLFITHDMLIVFYHFSINKKVYTRENWIDYMTGLTFINGRIYER